MLIQRNSLHWLTRLGRCVIVSAIVTCPAASNLNGQERTKQGSTSTEPRNAQKTDTARAKTETVAPKDASPDDKRPPAAAHRPLEQELERTSEGKIRFSFRQQPWLDVLRWLADSSGLTLDWQDLPEGVLNLNTQQAYTLDEARDLLNMHLAARGFTLLRRGEVLILTKLEKLNPALVPRVDEQELAARDPHEIVRVSFPLDWLVAETAAKEFAPMLSPFGKLLPMAATNRLEAIDTVANLREVRRLLMREQSNNGSDRLVVEFKLKHVRAEDILDKLKELVGTATVRGRSSDQMRMLLERMRRGEQERNQGQEQRRPVQKEPEVHLVINEQENSILANAPPDKLAVVRQAIQALDVPSSGSRRAGDTVTRMKIYRTKAIDPDAMADLIQELVAMGKLQSNTQVQADDDSNTLIVYAVPADHLAIANLVSQVDEDGRDVRIIGLRQLDIDYALQAVKLLLQGGSVEEGRGRRGDDGFRIEADSERNRLLLWATDEEYAEINSLLAKLGEDLQRTAGLSRGNAVRILNLPAQGAERTLDSLKQIWPNVRDNPLRIQGRRQAPDLRRTESRGGDESPDQDGPPKASEPSQRIVANVIEKSFPPTRFAVASVPPQRNADENRDPPADAAAPPSAETDASTTDSEAQDAVKKVESPPITITQSANGQLIITSKDVEALNSVESLLTQLMPAQADYVVFRLKHASPFAVELTLRQIFGVDAPRNRSEGRLPISSRPLLQFISDLDTGTLLVQGATAEQLTKIEQLIELYDQPEALDGELERKTEIYEVRYSRANMVAEVVKEVFRDLLSSNDKAFTPERKEGDSPSRDLGYGANYGSKIPRFKGLLSLGVEENTNTLVISAPVFLIGDVMKLIREVDQTAASHSAKVVTLNGVSAESLREVFAQMPGVTTSTQSRRGGTANGGGDSNGAATAATSRSGDRDRPAAGEQRESRGSARSRSESPFDNPRRELRNSRR